MADSTGESKQTCVPAATGTGTTCESSCDAFFLGVRQLNDPKTTFEQATKLVGTRALREATENVIAQAKLGDKTSARTLLASFLIARYPQQVLDLDVDEVSKSSNPVTGTDKHGASDDNIVSDSETVGDGESTAACSMSDSTSGNSSSASSTYSTDHGDINNHQCFDDDSSSSPSNSLGASKTTGGTSTGAGTMLPLQLKVQVWDSARALGAYLCSLNPEDRLSQEVVTALQTLWKVYADAFATWKRADAQVVTARMAQDYTRLLLRLRAYKTEASSSAVGEADPGLEQLILGTQRHMQQMKNHVAVLLGGPDLAGAWETAIVTQVEEIYTPRVQLAKSTDTGTCSRSSSEFIVVDGKGAGCNTVGMTGASEPSRQEGDSTGTGITSNTSTTASPDTSAESLFSSRLSLAHELCIDSSFRLPQLKMPKSLCLFDGAVTTSGEPSSYFNLSASGRKMTVGYWLDLLSGASSSPVSSSAASLSSFTTPGHHQSVSGTAFASTQLAFEQSVITALQSCIDSITALVPNRSDLHSALRGRVDLPLIQQMLKTGSMGLQDWTALVDYLFETVHGFEAPARCEDSSAWYASFKGTCAALLSTSSSTMSSTSVQASILPLLARFFAWMHFKFAQIRVDITNVHLERLAAFFKEGNRGIDYMKERLGLISANTSRFPRTVAWYQQTLQTMTAPAAKSRLEVAQEGLVSIMCSPLAAIASPSLPECLQFDKARLTRCQNDVQRLTLAAALSTFIVTQATGTGQSTSTGTDPLTAAQGHQQRRQHLHDLTEKFQSDLCVLLQDDEDDEHGTGSSEEAERVVLESAASAVVSSPDSGTANVHSIVALVTKAIAALKGILSTGCTGSNAAATVTACTGGEVEDTVCQLLSQQNASYQHHLSKVIADLRSQLLAAEGQSTGRYGVVISTTNFGIHGAKESSAQALPVSDQLVKRVVGVLRKVAVQNVAVYDSLYAKITPL